MQYVMTLQTNDDIPLKYHLPHLLEAYGYPEAFDKFLAYLLLKWPEVFAKGGDYSEIQVRCCGLVMGNSDVLATKELWVKTFDVDWTPRFVTRAD